MQPAAMQMYLALKMLLHQNPGTVEGEKIVKVRSWGKIMGTEKDYIIAECVIEGRQSYPHARKSLSQPHTLVSNCLNRTHS